MRLTRILIGIAATVTCLVLIAGTASAKTVYKYVYSGESFDGSGSSKGQFKALGGLDYDPATEKLFVSSPGAVTKFTKAGVPANFSALNNGAGRDYIDLLNQATGDISVDTSSNPSTKGNIYPLSGTFGYHPNGLVIEPAFGTATTPGSNGGCGTSGPNGEFWDFTSGGGVTRLSRRNLDTFKEEVTYLDEATFGSITACPLRLDSQANFYAGTGLAGFNGQAVVKLPPEPIDNGAGGTVAKPPEREMRYRLNAACCGLSGENNYPTHIGIDRSNDDVAIVESQEYGSPTSLNRVSLYDSKGGLLTQFGEAEGGYNGLIGAGGVTLDPVTHDVYVTNNRDYGAGVRHVEKFVRGPSFTVPTTDTEQPTQPSTPNQAVLHGSLNPDGLATKSCYFEYGLTQSLGSKAPCSQGQVLTGSSDIAVTAALGGLEKASKYWVKLFAANSANEIISDGGPEQFIAQSKPVPISTFVSKVNTDGANFNATIDPNGGRTWYSWEYGPTTSYGQKTPETRLRRENNVEFELPTSLTQPFSISSLVTGFVPGKPVHFRLVARNEQGTTLGPDQEFITYLQEGEPSCPNSLVRQQTGSALLLDCRAYEIASTSLGGGHDVVSSTVAGQEPLVAYPDASGRLLYSLDSASVPGVAGDPTNLGRDPYVAVRGPSGWTTEYVGLPSGGMADPGSFGSPLLEADSGLDQFAFGGKDICDPCFADTSTNIPLRRPKGILEKGMAGSLSPAADPAGEVRKHFSADGSTFVFGAEKKFEGTGNEGSVSIYKRNLKGGSTQVVSTMPDGSTMTGPGIAELDVSSNGDRVLIGKLVNTDGDGNKYFDLYMNVGGNPNSVEVVDSLKGAIFSGMTSDGSKVFFTTPDKLAGDGDDSNDFFVADVSGATSTITRLSTGTGGTGDTNACAPVADWNVVSGGPNCGTTSIAGGGGVAGDDGTAYFVSPELLDGAGNGEADQPNLYVVEPGQPPRFVATIDSSLVKPGPQPPKRPVVKSSFASSLESSEAIAVDQDTGDVYVLERGASQGIRRFDSAGNPKNFTDGPNAGTNKLLVSFAGGSSEAQVAFDSSGGLFGGDFYVSNGAGSVKLYAGTGKELGTIGGFTSECGLAVDQSNGALYVGDFGYGGIRRLAPISGATPVSAANYTATSIKTQGMTPCQVAADTAGNVYASQLPNGPAKKFQASDFSGAGPAEEGVAVASNSTSMYADPATGDIYVDESSQIGRYDSAGNLIQTIGSADSLGGDSRGVAINATTGHVYAASSSAVVEFGFEPVPYEPIDNPAVAHGVHDSATHSYEDFQVSPDGRYALFSSVLSLTGYGNQGHSELYRYDTESDSLACPSCAPTLQQAQSDVTMTPYGLNMTDDGRVFFTTRESFTLRDTNGRTDAYEWSSGRTELISSGLGPNDSALLSVGADGKDAYFFTRDSLARQDGNGSAVKIYDAREGGGFLFEDLSQPCAASDECHGAGTEQPPAPNINTATGEGQTGQPKGSADCGSLASKAKKESRRAARLRGKAKKKAAKRAKKLEKETKACTQANGGGAK